MSSEYIANGSVRVDLTGGTIDLLPISLILSDVHTLNIALSLKAKVKISPSSFNGIKIHSIDYEKEYEFSKELFNHKDLCEKNTFEEMSFIAQIVDYFKLTNIKIELSSGSPPGSGLGGSSSMGVTLFKALCGYLNKEFIEKEAIRIVQRIEGRILNAGIPGYQDYYPALYGGILDLESSIDGVNVNQLYSKELAEYLESHITLVYSGSSRKSGINNWEVYKAFFDKEAKVRDGLKKISEFSKLAVESIISNEYEKTLEQIINEGKVRESLFENILSSRIKSLKNDLLSRNLIRGAKACGAGGGGCFILIHDKDNKKIIEDEVYKNEMKILEFRINPPIS